MFRIPNAASATDLRAQVDSVHWQILEQAIRGDGVSATTDLEVTERAAGADMSVDYSAAVQATVAGVTLTSVAAGNVAVTSAHATLARFDLVCINDAGVVSVTAGTPAAAPTYPSIPDTSLVLAAVRVLPAAAAIYSGDIVDLRVGGVTADEQTPVVVALSPAAADIAQGTVGAAYSQTFTATGGDAPYAFAVTAGTEPTGLTLDPATGVLAGIPSAADTFTFTVTVTDAADRQRSISYQVVVAASPGAPPADTDNFDDGTVDTATWDVTGAVVESGGTLVTPEGTSAQTDASYDLELKWPVIQLATPNAHATGKSIAEVIGDGGDLTLRLTNANELSNFRDLINSHSPLLYWPLDENAGTAAEDESGSGHGGVYTGNYTLAGLQLATGDAANTVVGASTSYVISAYAPIVAGTKRTFMGWAKRDSTQNRALFGAGGTALRAEQSTNQLRFTNNSFTNSVGWDCGSALTSAFFWALTYDDLTRVAELYLNGASLGTKTLSQGFGAGSVFLAGAVDIGGAVQSWIGGFGHVAILGAIPTATQIDAIYDAGSGAGGGGGLLVEVVDTAVTVLSEQHAAATAGEYFRFGWAAGSLVFHRSGSGADPWTDITSSPLADDTRVAVCKLKLSSSNSAGNSAARNAQWDNYSWLDAPAGGAEPATVLDQHFVWTSSTSVGEDAARAYARHHRLNGYGVAKWGVGFQYLAGYGGYGNWDTSAGGGHSSGVNQQQERGEFSRLDDADRVGKPCVNGIYMRPGDGRTPALADTAAWTTYCTKIQNWATWCQTTGAAGISLDLESADWDYLSINATEATARARAYAAGAEFYTAVLAGFPTVDCFIYAHDLYRTWRWFAQVWYNGPAVAAVKARLVTTDFIAGMCSAAGASASRMIFLQSWSYKSPQGGQQPTAAGWQFAAHADVWGYNPNGTLLDRFGNSLPGILGMDWIFQNRFNDAGMATANRFCVWPFVWAGDTSTQEGMLASSAAHVTLQATELARFQLSLPYPLKGMAWFDYGRLSYAEATAPNGGYPAISSLFAL